MRAIAVIAAVMFAVAAGASVHHASRNRLRYEVTETTAIDFDTYIKEFGKKYNQIHDHAEYTRRSITFMQNVADIVAHNKDKSQTYKKGINRFTDMNAAERQSYLGTRLGRKLSEAVGAVPADLPALDASALPASVDWRKRKPAVLTPVKDQGQCGSCWAHAATEEVEFAVAAATGKLTPLSRQNIVDCAPNPDHCGGTGGCEGATAELAFSYVSQNGMASEAAYPYTAEDGTCNTGVAKVAKISNWVVLTSNNYSQIVTAVATQAPLAITVAAGTWFDYSSGVYTGCGSDFDLDHAVQLVGYGTDGMDYWTVRNSWGPDWGESGYIRVQKHSDGSDEWCGTDSTPSDGTGCTGGPSSVTACGSCGLWYDVCYPTGGSIPAAEF